MFVAFFLPFILGKRACREMGLYSNADKDGEKEAREHLDLKAACCYASRMLFAWVGWPSLEYGVVQVFLNYEAINATIVELMGVPPFV